LDKKGRHELKPPNTLYTAKDLQLSWGYRRIFLVFENDHDGEIRLVLEPQQAHALAVFLDASTRSLARNETITGEIKEN
jgi:hypothetical protein